MSLSDVRAISNIEEHELSTSTALIGFLKGCSLKLPGVTWVIKCLLARDTRAIVRLLTDHCDAPGRQTIVYVRVLKAESTAAPSFYVVLADAPRGEPAKAEKAKKRSAAGQKRHDKKRQKLNSDGKDRTRRARIEISTFRRPHRTSRLPRPFVARMPSLDFKNIRLQDAKVKGRFTRFTPYLDCSYRE